MHSTYRIKQSSNTHTRKQKASNHIEHDLNMKSNDLKMTTSDLKDTSKESVKSNRRSKLKGGMLNDKNSIQGRDPTEQAFSSQQMAEFIEIILKKDSKVQNEITQTVEKYNKESDSKQSKIGQNAVIQSKVFEQAVNIMRDTFEDMDIEKEQKDNKIEFLENEIGLPDCKVIEEMNILGLNKISSKKRW